MPGVEFVLPNGKRTTLVYNGIALLQLAKGGADRRILGENTPEGKKALFNTAFALAQGGEMESRYMGECPKDIPSAKEFSELPEGYALLLKIAVLEAIIEGSGMSDNENGDNEEIDEGLQELAEQCQKSHTDIMADVLSIGAIAGLNAKESMILPLSVLHKLAEQNTKTGGISKWRMML